jgi:hypothetical protein
MKKSLTVINYSLLSINICLLEIIKKFIIILTSYIEKVKIYYIFLSQIK